MKKLLFLLLPLTVYSQATGVGVNTTSPEQTLDVNGTMAIRTVPVTTSNYSVLVIDETTKQVKKVSLSTLNASMGTCPNFVKSQSNGYYLLFSSPSSIPNPNNSLVINGLNFAWAGTWTSNNTYYYSYTNTSGTPLNINNFSVTFTSITCNYQ